MPCNGNRDDHCCYLNGKACPYLEKNTIEGRLWSCGLYNKLQDWNAVILSDEYKADVAPVFEPLGMICRDFPDGDGANSYICIECGVG